MLRFLLTILFLSSCQTSTITVTSNPKGAQVEVFNPDSQSYEAAGTTPYEISDEQSAIPLSVLASDLVSIRISQPGFISEQVLLEKDGRPQITIHANLIESGSKSKAESDNGKGKRIRYDNINEIAKVVSEIQRDVQKQKIEDAHSKIDGLLNRFPLSYFLWDIKGSLSLMDDDKSAAIQAYRRSVEINADNIDTKIILKKLEK